MVNISKISENNCKMAWSIYVWSIITIDKISVWFWSTKYLYNLNDFRLKNICIVCSDFKLTEFLVCFILEWKISTTQMFSFTN